MSNYKLMHKDEVVLEVYTNSDKVIITNYEKLPFNLRDKGKITVSMFNSWLDRRIDNLSRTYMNRVYIARRVGRDKDKIIRDSAGISITDSFWIKGLDVDMTWGELKAKQDISLDLVNIALTGEIHNLDFTKALDDTTSLYTIKGAFPKGLFRGYILKKGNNAEYEAIAYSIGKYLGVNTAKAVIGDNGLVECKIFTCNNVSLVHTEELLHFTDYGKDSDGHRSLYDYFAKVGRVDLRLTLERLYILNFLLINTDFNYENFGVLYDNETFNLLAVAPAYDFNNAFEAYKEPSVYYTWIYNNIKKFIGNHQDIKRALARDEFEKLLVDLTSDQSEAVNNRRKYLLST